MTQIDELKKDLQKLIERDASDSITTFDPQKTPTIMTYAWNWFSYHANQRLTAFHYFLIIVGFLVAGYITCVEKKLYALQVVLGFVGVLISVAFLALDARNEQLVDDGRDALRKLEQALAMGQGIHTADYLRVKDAPMGEILFNVRAESLIGMRIRISHGFWLEWIERVAMVLFLAALLLGISNWYYEGRSVGADQPKSVRLLKS
jgi:hypothetical protein